MKLADLFVEVSVRGLRAAQANLSRFQGKLEMASRSMDVLAKWAKRGFVAIGGALALAAREAIRFQEQLANVATMLTSSTMNFLPKYAKALKAMAVEFGQSTATLSKGLYDILSAGVDASKALDVLSVASKAATGQFTQTGVAAKAIVSTLNAYGQSAEHAMEVSDRLVTVVQGGQITFAELARNIGKVATIASQAGVSMDELMASIATVTKSGVSAEETMTAVRATIRAFLKPSAEAQKAVKNLDLELNTATLRTKGLIGAMKELKKLPVETIAKIFGEEGMKGSLQMIQDLSGYTEQLAMQQNKAGATVEDFAKAQGTVAFKMRQVREQFLNAARTLGEAMLPAAEEAVGWFRHLAEALEANAGPILDFLKWVLKVTAKVVALSVALKALAGAIKIVNIALAAGPWGIIATAIGAILAVAIPWEKLLGKIKGRMDELIDRSRTLAQKQKEEMEALKTHQGELRRKVARYRELLEMQERSRGEEAEMMDIARELNKEMPGVAKAMRDAAGDAERMAVAMAKAADEFFRMKRAKLREQVDEAFQERDRALDEVWYWRKRIAAMKEYLRGGGAPEGATITERIGMALTPTASVEGVLSSWEQELKGAEKAAQQAQDYAMGLSRSLDILREAAEHAPSAAEKTKRELALQEADEALESLKAQIEGEEKFRRKMNHAISQEMEAERKMRERSMERRGYGAIRGLLPEPIRAELRKIEMFRNIQAGLGRKMAPGEKEAIAAAMRPDRADLGRWQSPSQLFRDLQSSAVKDTSLGKKQVDLLTRIYNQSVLQTKLFEEGVPFIPQQIIGE